MRAETVKDVRKKMGSRFELTAVHADGDVARQAIVQAYQEIDRLEAMISSWRESSETSLVNRHAGIRPIEVSSELFGLVRRSLKISRLTGGAFDITFAGVGTLWDMKAPQPRLPTTDELEGALTHVGFGKVKLDPAARTIFLDDPGARVGFGAIGKGYAANRAVFILREHGVVNGAVNAGGDLVAFGLREDGSDWEIGIAHPRFKNTVFARLPISDQAVVTSGDYESFVEIDGKRYAHILDPRTGMPVDHLQSATILCPDAELADALATATFVLGPKQGLELVDALNGVEALMVDPAGKIHVSKNLRSRMALEESATPAQDVTPAKRVAPAKEGV